METDKILLKEIKKGETGHGLLIEHDGFLSLDNANNKVIKEGFDPSNWHVPYPFIVNAVFQKSGIKNANGRIYPREILEREIANYQTRIRENRATGECDHPDTSTISIDRVSHNITELHWEGNTVVGKLQILVSMGFIKYGIVTCLADTVANLLLNGVKLGVSSRAIGSVEQRNGVLMVGDDLEILAWDIVSDPSTPNAWISDSYDDLRPYVESKNIVGSALNEKIDKIEKLLL